jgi:hypothetical protein
LDFFEARWALSSVFVAENPQNLLAAAFLECSPIAPDR